MLNKLVRLYTIIFVVTSFFTACSSRQNEDLSQKKNENIDSKNIEKESGNDSTLEFSDQQLNYQIKKLNSEINYIKDQVMALDVKSSLYADPFDIYNKEIMLNNGSSIFCKILSQTATQIFVETLIGNLTIDRSSVVRIVENITVLDEDNNISEIVEITQDEKDEIISDVDLIKQRQMQSSASVILIEDIKAVSYTHLTLPTILRV